MLYKVTADLYGRTLAFRNTKGEQVAVMAKTRSALIKCTNLSLFAVNSFCVTNLFGDDY